MKITSAEYIKGAVKQEHYPNDNLPEILLSGRSNVGKSSFINSMLNRKKIAKTSSRPGKTQTLNFFLINEKFYFVDVPGYGYATVSKKQREEFGQMIEEYLQTRSNLKLIVLLVDSRHKPSEDDILMYNYIRHYNIPVMVVCTKIDKVKKNSKIKHEKMIKDALGFDGNHFNIYSSETKEGLENAWKVIKTYI